MSTILELGGDSAGGTWVTINGVHVLIKGGMVAEGPSSMKGKTVKELGDAGQHVSDVHGAEKPVSHQYAPAKGTAEYEDMKTSDPNRLRDQAMHDKFFANAPAGKEEAMAESIKSQAKSGTFSVFAETPLTDADKERLSAYRVVAHKNGYEIGPYKANTGSGTVTATITKRSSTGGGRKSVAPFSGDYVLELDEQGEGTPLPLALEGLPTTNDADQPIHYRKMRVAMARDWTHRGTGEPIPITKERIEEWKRVTASLSAAGVRPFIPGEHREKFNAKDNYGYVLRLDREGEDAYAVVALHGDDSLKIAAKNSRSIYIKRDMMDASGKVHPGEGLHHLSLTPDPALPNLGGMIRIAASADGSSIEIPVFTPAPRRKGSNMSPQLATKAREKFGLKPDQIPDEKLDDAVAEKALALSADVEKITGERDTAKQEASAKAQEVLALSANDKEPDALSLSLITRTFKTDRERVIESGVISEAGMKELDTLLLPNGKPGKFALALSAGSPEPLYCRVCDILRRNPGVKTDNAIPRDVQARADAEENITLSLSGDLTKIDNKKLDRQAELLREQLGTNRKTA